ncbi:MAG TPA: hypothetical protein VF943_14570 [Burkholderiales bacterium]
MRYRITAESGYLKAELFERRTAAETRDFLNAVAAAGVKHRLRVALICVRLSDPIFSLERFGYSAFLDLAAKISDRIALMADSPELRIAHEYAVMIARWRGINVRTFRSETAAIEWLKGRRRSPERRRNLSHSVHPERRAPQPRRGREAQRLSG